MSYDDIIVFVGGFGRYQRRICFLLFLAAIPSALHSMAGVFLGAQPKFRCLLPFENLENVTYYYNNYSYSNNNNNDDNDKYSQCELYQFDNDTNFSSTTNHSINKCNTFVYDKTIYDITAVSEFNLVCNHAWLKATSDSLFMVGIMLGALIFGALSDVYGRKPIFCLSVIFNFIGGLLVSLAPDIISYMIFRLLLGISVNAIYLITYVSAVEMVVPKWRVMVGGGVQLSFSIGYILTALFAYFLPNWRIFQVAITLPSLLLLTYWWFIPESVRWLLTKNRLEDAKYLIMKTSNENRVELSEDILNNMLNVDNSSSIVEKLEKEQMEKPSVLDLFKHPNLRRKTFLLFFNWFVNNTTYYGLSWNAGNLGGNVYVNFVIAGLAEIPAHTFVLFTLNRWGRKLILCGCMTLAGVSLILAIFVPTDMQWLVVALATIGKLAITSSFDIVYIFSAEQYPTVIRNVGVGACSTFSRLGGISAPYIIYSSSFWKPLPYVVFGILSLMAGITALFLPETLNQKLPESIQDGEDFGKKNVIVEDNMRKY